VDEKTEPWPAFIGVIWSSARDRQIGQKPNLVSALDLQARDGQGWRMMAV
jgi:hypothetical protein